MAITDTCVRFLFYAKDLNVSFKQTLTLGRLQFLADKKTVLEKLQKSARSFHFQDELELDNKYADPFFHILGAEEVNSLDYSAYEGASIIHDLNSPISQSLKNSFTAVVDGGTLEHVFNFPQAIKNVMESLVKGGHFIGFSPANNLMGHGFYQFSPELFFRVFSKENGFEIVKMFIVAADFDVDTENWYEISDPNDLKERVTLTNSIPSFIMIIAKKNDHVELFSPPPYQSDYASTWNKKGNGDNQFEKRTTIIDRIKNKFKKQKIEDLEKINPKFFKKRKNKN